MPWKGSTQWLQILASQPSIKLVTSNPRFSQHDMDANALKAMTPRLYWFRLNSVIYARRRHRQLNRRIEQIRWQSYTAVRV